MSVTEAVAIIGALMLVISTISGSVISIVKLFDEVHDNREKIGALQNEITQYKALTAEFDDYRKRVRQDIILMGESLAMNRADNAKLALLVNQLFNQYEAATGQQPKIDMDMLHQMTTISYITGPLGPLNVDAVKRAS